jgi:CubicO group peptidase (beta-lactamase class C family)
MKKFRIRWLWLLLGSLLAGPVPAAEEWSYSTPEKAGYDGSKLNALTDRLDRLYENGSIPNYVLALAKDGEIFFETKRGNKDLEAATPVDLDTIYLVASMTKPLATTAALLLVDEGRLSLDDKLSDFFPEFDGLMVAPGGSFDSIFEEMEAPITVKNLITHTSGFTYGENVTGFGDVAKQYDELFWGKCHSSQEFLELLAQVPLVAQPGTTFNYSYSTDVLGAIVEKISGKKLGQFLQERLFDPLGMDRSGFHLSKRPELLANVARMYAPGTAAAPSLGILEPDGVDWKLAPFQTSIGGCEKNDSAGGGMFASSSDYLKYISMMADGGKFKGEQIIKEEIAAIQFQNLVPGLGLEAFEDAFGEAAEYMTFGGGFGIKSEEGDSDEADYYFWGGIFNTFFWIDLRDRSVGVFSTHHYPVQYNIIDDLEQIVDDARL